MDLSFLMPGGSGATASPTASAAPQFDWLINPASDPAARQAMLVAGLTMLQNPNRLNTVGQLASGAMSGLQFYGQQKQVQAEQQRKQEAHNAGLETQRLQQQKAQMELDQAPKEFEQASRVRETQIARDNLEIERINKTMGALIEKANTEVEAGKLSLNTQKKLQALYDKNPKLWERSALAELAAPYIKQQETTADIGLRGAQAGLMQANADEQRLINEGLAAVPKGDRLRAKAGAGSSSAEAQRVDAQMQSWLLLNPNATPQEQAKQKLSYWNQAKQSSIISAANSIVTNSDYYTPEQVQQAQQVLATALGTAPAAAVPAAAKPKAGQTPTARYWDGTKFTTAPTK